MMDFFILRFLLSTFFISLLILAILLTKKIFYNHMSKQTHYKIWYFLLIPLIVLVFPRNFFTSMEITQRIKSLFYIKRDVTLKNEGISGLNVPHESNTDLLHDFAVSVNKTPDFIYHAFIIIWVIGILFFIGIAIYANYQIYQLKRSATIITNQQINEMLEVCKEAVGVRKKVKLKESPLFTSPVTFGLLQPYILLPKNNQEKFLINDLKYIFLHELTHHKNKDVFINYILLLLQLIYWFNPFVWRALKSIRIDREVACDASVLNILDESKYIEYGQTIIHFADKVNGGNYDHFVSGMGGTKNQMKQRIQNIVCYSKDSSLLKWKSKIICTILGIFVLCLLPFTTSTASFEDVYHFTEENAIYEDLSVYFYGYDGSFVLYDASKKQYQIYNREISERRVSPNSTYKIYSALFALETNVISPTDSEQIWDEIEYPYPEWNRDHNLFTAMSSSVNWYFQNMDHKVGKKQLQYYIDNIEYGNQNLSGNSGSFWIESSLKISPIEQVQLLYNLDNNSFNFKEETIRTVKNTIFIEEQANARLYGKTGTGMVNGKNISGWFIGFVEKDDDTYYFAVNIRDENGNINGSKAAEIANQILHDKKIY